MKRFDGFSIRGLVFSVLALAGMGYELFFSSRRELWIVAMYGLVLCLGLVLIFFVKDREE